MDKLIIIFLLSVSILQGDVVFANPSAGGDGEYISCGTDAQLDNFWAADGMTMCVRLNITGAEPTNVQPRLWSSRDGAGGVEFLVDLTATADIPKINIDFSTTDMFVNGGTVNTDFWTISTGWRTFCASFDTPVNGMGAGSTVMSTELGDLADSTVSLSSGTAQTDAGHDRRLGVGTTGAHHLTGQLGWMVIWNDQVDQSEITRISTRRKTLHQAMTVRSNNVVMAFQFADGENGQTEVDQAVIQDIGPFRHHCTLIGGTYARRTLNQ